MLRVILVWVSRAGQAGGDMVDRQVKKAIQDLSGETQERNEARRLAAVSF